MLVVTAYAIFFGLLRWLRVPGEVFVAVTLYFTTVIYCQWAMFGGRHATWACVLTSGGLFALGFLAANLVAPYGWPLVLLGSVPFLLFGAILGICLAGLTDLGLLVIEAVRGGRLNPLQPDASPFRSARDSRRPTTAG